jgi:hypothetical protein
MHTYIPTYIPTYIHACKVMYVCMDDGIFETRSQEIVQSNSNEEIDRYAMIFCNIQ